jgi:urease accessory protein UreF
MTTTRPTTHFSDTEALREQMQLTRRHLADTVHALSRRLNVPRRIKESATGAGHRAVQAAGGVLEKAMQVPELSRRHPRETAAVGGAVALGVGAAAWIAGRRK